MSFLSFFKRRNPKMIKNSVASSASFTQNIPYAEQESKNYQQIHPKYNISLLPVDVLLIIAESLDLRSIIALRTASRQLYLTFPYKAIFREIRLANDISPIQLDKLLHFLESINATGFIHQVTFYEMSITHESLISILARCENLRQLRVYGCQNIKLRKITKALVKWQHDDSGDSPKLVHLKSLILTRCVGGPRRNYPALKVNKDLQILKKHIIELAECDDRASGVKNEVFAGNAFFMHLKIILMPEMSITLFG
ncbi:2072_t:CDS:2 [Ambispora leptoticha]|uniref:2072_t:CDS:1 n=1 Tax=Ambispora leptoticha TaxID=144679 RepID=A0A9N9HDX0_9GLOM|nr:2072_t:CDS:2 [Ambispora leptoticha]